MIEQRRELETHARKAEVHSRAHPPSCPEWYILKVISVVVDRTLCRNIISQGRMFWFAPSPLRISPYGPGIGNHCGFHGYLEPVDLASFLALLQKQNKKVKP
ncbi:hypothetical protein CDL15_Pgr014251 [Punica granatum]|uniref:Uncharacterized protein n=1 Tax=Punica granatum TaxID=22663 RepID=A0A218WDP1_PUNGR|nr:hypothetical protein CDL15_Pgr014251 [Punica granatum]